MNPEREPPWWPRAAVVLLLAAIALATRLPAPWRVEVINDEMYHLESWMRRYRSDDVAPLFHRQLAGSRVLDSRWKARIEDLYRRGPLVQRLVCVKNDYGSFGFSTMAEVIEALSHSNLIALRLPSVAFALATVVLAYLAGRALRDRALGLWLAVLVTVGPLPQVYAGLGRPHGLTQLALFLVVYRFILEQKQDYPSPRRLLLAALFAQTTHLTCWAGVGVLVLSELVRRRLRGATPGTLVRQTWWYAALSLAFLGIIAFNGLGTSFFLANVSSPGSEKIGRNFCLASPFGHLAALGDEGLWASGLLFCLLIALGAAALFAPGTPYRGVRWPFLVVAGFTMSVPMVASHEVRHQMIYGVVPMVLAAIGARALFRSERAGLAGQAVVLLVLGGLALVRPADPYETILPAETRYSEVAARLARELAPGDVWLSWPYFAGIPLARYQPPPLPEPILPLNPAELDEALRGRPADRSLFVLTGGVFLSLHPALREAEPIATFSNDLRLLRFPPRREGLGRAR